MGYRRRSYFSRNEGMAYSLRSEAYRVDGGANDEGWHYRYCSICGTEAEHARGGGCVDCDNRAILARKSNRQ